MFATVTFLKKPEGFVSLRSITRVEIKIGGILRHNRKKKDMKTTKLLLLTTLSAAAIFWLTSQANAQYRATGADGITASPSLRKSLDEWRKVTVTPEAAREVAYQATGADGITASPKLRQALADRTTRTTSPSSENYLVGYRATGRDGITASPKLRQTLDEHATSFQIAPVK